MPCYTTVRTQIRDLTLATEAARKLGWTVEPNPDRFGQGIAAVFGTPAGTLRLRQFQDGTYQAQGVLPASARDGSGRGPYHRRRSRNAGLSRRRAADGQIERNVPTPARSAGEGIPPLRGVA